MNDENVMKEDGCGSGRSEIWRLEVVSQKTYIQM
jgi:hypothetical protein